MSMKVMSCFHAFTVKLGFTLLSQGILLPDAEHLIVAALSAVLDRLCGDDFHIVRGCRGAVLLFGDTFSPLMFMPASQEQVSQVFDASIRLAQENKVDASVPFTLLEVHARFFGC